MHIPESSYLFTFRATLNPTFSIPLNRRSEKSHQWTLLKQHSEMLKTASHSYQLYTKQNVLKSFLLFVLTTVLWEKQVSNICYPYLKVGDTDQENKTKSQPKKKQTKFKIFWYQSQAGRHPCRTFKFITRLEKQIWFTINFVFLLFR